MNNSVKKKRVLLDNDARYIVLYRLLLMEKIADEVVLKQMG